MNKNKYNRGASIGVAIIVILVILVLGYVVINSMGKSSTSNTAPNENTNTNTVKGTSSIDADLNSVDTALDGMSGDSATIDTSLNDKQIEQPQ